MASGLGFNWPSKVPPVQTAASVGLDPVVMVPQWALDPLPEVAQQAVASDVPQVNPAQLSETAFAFNAPLEHTVAKFGVLEDVIA